MTTSKKEKPARKKKSGPAAKRPAGSTGAGKATRRNRAATRPAATGAAGPGAEVREKAVTPGSSPGSPGLAPSGSGKKPKDLMQTLVDYADAEKAGAVVKEEEKEEVDPQALERGDVPMTVVGHLDELRSRIIISLITFFILTIGAFVFSEELLAYITGPFTDMARTMATPIKLNVFKLTEGLTIRIKVSAILALLVSFPFLMWQMWRFILPAITKKDRMFSRVSLLASILLFYTGVVFVFYGIVPFTVKVLISMVPTEMMSTIGANDYISLVFFFSVIMGVLFELPIIMMILTRIGIVSPSFLVSRRKYAFVMAFVVAAAITPTQDMLTMLVVAVPLIFLYEASIIVSKFTVRRKKKKEIEEESR